MKKFNNPLMLFNAGIVDTTALARVDREMNAFSAEQMDNWLPKVQGPMRFRPGTKYVGSTLNDTGASFIEFVAAIDQVALLEITDEKMRVWLGSDAHNLSLLGRPLVNTTVSLSDTGWYEANVGGGTRASGSAGEIPAMIGPTTSGVTMSASSEEGVDPTFFAYNAGIQDNEIIWASDSDTNSDTGWLQVDFGTARQIEKVVIQAPDGDGGYAPKLFSIQGNHADTGDLNSWTTEQSPPSQGDWSAGEQRTFTDTGYSDTGGNPWRYWRVYVQETEFEGHIEIGTLQMIAGSSGDTGQTVFTGAGLSLNAGAKGAIARVKKAVASTDTGNNNKEHSLNINVTCGPVGIRVGKTDGTDDLVSETNLGTGHHSLAFIPTVLPFYITLQTSDTANRVVSSLSIGDSGTVEITAPWETDTGLNRGNDLKNIRYDQSQDVLFVASAGVQQYKIERRGDGVSVGRSWSVVKYFPQLGPFRTNLDQKVKLGVNGFSGNISLTSNVPFFKSGHVGALFRLTHDGQSTTEKLGFLNAATSAVSVSGIAESDTGDPANFSVNNERRVSFSVTGTWEGTITIQRSFESKDFGFSEVSAHYITSGNSSDTGTFITTIQDKDDNAKVYYRAVLTAHAASEASQLGTASVAISAPRSVRSGIFRILNVADNMTATVEVISPPSSTALTNDWNEGTWSEYRGFPSSIALHEGRLCHAGVGSLWLSVSDDYENFDDEKEGSAAPIVRTFGSGPVDKIFYLASMQSLLAGSSDAELSVRSSSRDEVLTPENASARRISSQGAANLRPIKRDQDVLFVQRSTDRLYSVSHQANNINADTEEHTVFVPSILKGGVVSLAIQRQPETRMHFVLADGTVALYSYDPLVSSMAWSKWVGDTGTNAFVEQVSVLPAVQEDAVYYLVKRTIGGATKRYIEKWAKETESFGDTGLSYLSDCSKSYTDAGRSSSITGFQHLAGANVVVWADDTGQTTAGKDLSPDTPSGQTEYAVGTGGATDTGEITLSEAVHHAVAGLPYKGVWTSSKLAYDASVTLERGTALGQMKRSSQIAFVLYKTHNNGLFFGNDTGYLDALPRKSDEGSVVDADKIFTTLDITAMPFPGVWDEDSRMVLVAKSPRPATVMAAVPSNILNEK